MRYSLVYYNDDNLIDITGYGNYFQKKYNEKSLADIVDFTNIFANEEDLKFFLIYIGCLPKNCEGVFGIAFYKSQKDLPYILPYGISFNSDAKYFNFDDLTKYYIAHRTNRNFMESFFKTFDYLENVPQFAYFLKELKNNYNCFLDNGRYDPSYHLIMKDFLYQYVNSKNKNGKNISFSKLRNLAMFVINYKRECNLKNKLNDNRKDDIKKTIAHYKYLLTEENLPQEVIEAYESVIKNMYHSLNDIEITRGRNK